MIVCSVAACVIQVRYEVSLTAVCRYFTRPFYREANLERELSSHLTTAQLEALFANDSTTNLGGFVYRDEGTLYFYPHQTRRSEATRAEQTENHRVFPRLLGLYQAGDLRGLVDELATPTLRARLVREGVGNLEIEGLRGRVSRAASKVERIRLLRSMLPHIAHFVPYEGEPYVLPFAEKLRFYEKHHPRGDFVGTFEVLGLRLGPETDDEFGRSMATQSHHFTILLLPGGRILIKDYFGRRLRTYTVRMIEHPSGRRLFKVA